MSSEACDDRDPAQSNEGTAVPEPDPRERLLVLLDALASEDPELPVTDLWEYVRALRAEGEPFRGTETDVLNLLRVLAGSSLVEKRIPGGYRLSATGQREASAASQRQPEIAKRARRAVKVVSVGA